MSEPDEQTTEDEHLARIEHLVVHGLPFNAALGVEAIHLRGDEAELRVPFSERLADENGSVHGAVVTALLDATCAAAVLTKLLVPKRIATLDLRIDRLQKSARGRGLCARARVVHGASRTVLVEATAFNDDDTTVIARAIATFAVFAKPSRRRNEAEP